MVSLQVTHGVQHIKDGLRLSTGAGSSRKLAHFPSRPQALSSLSGYPPTIHKTLLWSTKQRLLTRFRLFWAEFSHLADLTINADHPSLSRKSTWTVWPSTHGTHVVEDAPFLLWWLWWIFEGDPRIRGMKRRVALTHFKEHRFGRFGEDPICFPMNFLILFDVSHISHLLFSTYPRNSINSFSYPLFTNEVVITSSFDSLDPPFRAGLWARELQKANSGEAAGRFLEAPGAFNEKDRLQSSFSVLENLSSTFCYCIFFQRFWHQELTLQGGCFGCSPAPLFSNFLIWNTW